MKSIYGYLTSNFSTKVWACFTVGLLVHAIFLVFLALKYSNLSDTVDDAFEKQLPNLEYSHQISQELQENLIKTTDLLNAQSAEDALGFYQSVRGGLQDLGLRVSGATPSELTEKVRQDFLDDIQRLETLADENYDVQLELADFFFRRQVIKEEIELAASQGALTISNIQSEIARELDLAIRAREDVANEAPRHASALQKVAAFYAQFIQLRELTLSLSETFDPAKTQDLMSRANFLARAASLGLLQVENADYRKQLAATLSHFQRYSRPEHEMAKITTLVADIQSLRQQERNEVRADIANVLAAQTELADQNFSESVRVGNLLGETVQYAAKLIFWGFPLVIIPLSTAIALILHYNVSSRLIRLADTVGQIADGDTDAPNNIRGNDEIAVISRRLEDFRRTTKQLLLSNANLERFAYVASHDLRAPLHAIHNLASWTLEDAGPELQPEHRENLEVMIKRVERLEGLSEDLLLYAKLSTKAAKYDNFRLSDIVEDVIEIAQQDGSVTFDVDIFKGSVLSARTPIRQILLNVVSNSIKHHDQETCHIKIEAKRYGNSFKLTISDDGPGIDPEYHRLVLEPFSTLRPRDDVEGSGLGLSIVDTLARSIDAQLTLISDPNIERGTTIVLDVPILSEPPARVDLRQNVASMKAQATPDIASEEKRYG